MKLPLTPSPMWKFTIINFLIGGAIALILSVLLVLGLRIFIPPPEYPKYQDQYSVCNKGLSVDDDCYRRQQEKYQRQVEDYQKISNEYSGKIFIAANIVGLVILLSGIMAFMLGLGTNIGAGIIIAGAFGIGFGYVWGWNGADDKVKFAVGLVVALIVIGGGILVNRMRHKTLPQSTPTAPVI